MMQQLKRIHTTILTKEIQTHMTSFMCMNVGGATRKTHFFKNKM